jgi:hypothetical protein
MEPIDDRKLPRMQAADGRRLSRKDARKLATSARALRDLERWLEPANDSAAAGRGGRGGPSSTPLDADAGLSRR